MKWKKENKSKPEDNSDGSDNGLDLIDNTTCSTSSISNEAEAEME
jgi:hypothetical protein